MSEENDKPNGPWGNNDGNGKPNNEPSNPWAKPNDPWSKPKGNDAQSQNLDDLARRIEDKLKAALSGKGGGGGGFPPEFNSDSNPKIFTLIGLLFLVLWASSGVYKVDQGEQALITRFGKFVRIADNGLNYRLPAPFENHILVNMQRVNSSTIGNMQGGSDAEQNLMLTGDENIVNVSFQVFWRVKNAENFVFNVAHGQTNSGSPDETVSAVAEAAMREVVGRSVLEKVLTTGRAQVEDQTKELMQRILDSYGSGIQITQVNLRKSEPPASVVQAFREVAAASQEAETRINQALSYRNSVVPQAQGEAAKFNQIYQEYKLAPEVTRQRLYLETMEKIYERANKVIVDKGAGNGSMMVLPPELLKSQSKASAKEGGN